MIEQTFLTEKKLKNTFDLYYKSLVVFANRFLVNIDVCEDLVQDVFVAYWSKDLDFPNQTASKVYLFKAVRNKCYNYIKHLKVRDNHIKNNINDIESNNAFLKEVLEEEILNTLHASIDKLPNRKKEIIQYSLKGLKNNEIAEVMNIKLQTVKTLKSQAYQILRTELKELDAFVLFLITNL